MSKEPAVVIFNDVEPVKFYSWDEFKEGVWKVMAVSSWKLILKDVRVRQWEKIALTTATPVFSGKHTGKSFKVDMRHTAVWEKKRSRRLIIH